MECLVDPTGIADVLIDGRRSHFCDRSRDRSCGRVFARGLVARTVVRAFTVLGIEAAAAASLPSGKGLV